MCILSLKQIRINPYLRKGSLKHSSNYCIIDISRNAKTRQNFTCFYSTTKIFLYLAVIKVANVSDYMLPVDNSAITPTRAHNEGWVTLNAYNHDNTT